MERILIGWLAACAMCFVVIWNITGLSAPPTAPAPREMKRETMIFSGKSLVRLRADNLDLQFADEQMRIVLGDADFECVIFDFKKDAMSGKMRSLRIGVTTTQTGPRAKDILLIDESHRDFANMVEMYERFFR